jgi:exodeoxyribonuclease V gamma subunit
MLHLHHSNRLERLLERLVAVTEAPLSDPFAPEAVVVQNPGMARWVGQQLARATGIAANLDFPLPARFVWDVFRAWFPDLPERSGFDREALLWRAMALLPGHLSEPTFTELARYLASGPSALKRYQLCRRIADVFDQYLVYRPDWVLAWEAGEEDHWQARLWRAMVASTDGRHRARLYGDFFAAMAREPEGPLPERVSVFGLSALAPAYLEVLGALAGRLEVHIFLLNPSREYWADIVDEKGQARRRARWRAKGLADASGLLDVGNPLLAAMGHSGQELLDQLLDQSEASGGLEHDDFAPGPRDTLLRRLQDDVLDLVDRRSRDAESREPVAARDASLQVHACHGPLREVQVLHDRLLALLDEGGPDGLTPRDIVVMAPDIEAYAPYVDAVFGAAEEGLRIPWSIADRRPAAEAPVVDTVLALLDLPLSRLTASEVLALLESPPVQRRLGLDADGVARVRRWVREANIRWGTDGAMRAELGLPGDEANTWAFGLARLFLGYALPPRATLYRGILGYPDVEGGEAEDLGALQTLLDRLTAWRRRLAGDYPPGEWQDLVGRLLDDLFDPDEAEAVALQAIREAVDGLVEQAAAARFEEPIPRDMLRAHLADALEEPVGAQRFLTGRVTFCNMVPMRSIPFRVVALLGLNDTDFPRVQRPAGFDLMAQRPRRGDRSRRRDDRYLFLEALLSARDVLYLSYVGHDIRDNSERVPSVVVDELLDYVTAACCLEGGGDLRQHLVVSHPLQPFSPRYFADDDPRLYSYARDWLSAAQAEGGGVEPVFADAPVPVPEAGELALDTLVRFLESPARAFLEQRLGMGLPEEAEAVADSEPFYPDALEGYSIRQRVLERVLEGEPAQAALPMLRGAGELPHGPLGELVFGEQGAGVEDYARRLQARLGEPRDALEVDLPLGSDGPRLRGWLRGLTAHGQVRHRFGRLKAKDRLRLWLRHLALCALAPEGIAPVSVHVAEDLSLTLAPVAYPMDRLADLLAAWRSGMAAPLPFFPETSLARARQGSVDGKVLKAWRDDWSNRGEAFDAAVATAFRGVVRPLDDAFEEWAERLLAPMLDVSSEVAAEDDA